MQESTVEITIDGHKVACQAGESIIQVADRHGIYIPRFCYHERLSVVANCRMCLVEVEGAAKALPACATPINKDMVVKTQSPVARSAQQAVMQFLLINHPLDCPICDQGGECDLQDVAMGYGAGISKFTDKKRAVSDEDLGPLVATVMTRCIHCTRCVRFGDEIAGIPELVLTQRGGSSKISTYLKQGLASELSGNMIDVCPVGALTSKPFKFTGRSWGFEQHSSIAMHDCVGSSTYLHIDKTAANGQARVMRVVPKTNEQVNDQWLSDIDRFSYEAIRVNRVTAPMIKKNAKWHEVDWFTALDYAARGLRKVMVEHGDNEVAVITNPQASLEEAYMQQLVMRAEGITNIDHRVRMRDFAYDKHEACYPSLGLTLEQVSEQKSIVIIGGDIRRQQPMLNHRIRQAALADSKVSLIHAYDPGYNFELTGSVITSPKNWEQILSQLLALANNQTDASISQSVHEMYANIEQTGYILFGLEAIHHPQYSKLRHLANELAATMKLTLGMVSDGPNSAGMYLAGVLPARGQFAEKLAKTGDPYVCNFSKAAKAYWLHQFNCFDSFQPEQAKANLNAAEFVVSCQSYNDPISLEYADVILPLALPNEISGIWVNAEGRWQNSQAAIMPYAQAKPGWKIYRALADCLEQDHINFNDLITVREELQELYTKLDYKPTSTKFEYQPTKQDNAVTIMNYWPANQVDVMVRTANALQNMPKDQPMMHPDSLDKCIDTVTATANVNVALDTLIIPLYDQTGDKL